MHGISSRVLRGVMTGAPVASRCSARRSRRACRRGRSTLIERGRRDASSHRGTGLRAGVKPALLRACSLRRGAAPRRRETRSASTKAGARSATPTPRALLRDRAAGARRAARGGGVRQRRDLARRGACAARSTSASAASATASRGGDAGDRRAPLRAGRERRATPGRADAPTDRAIVAAMRGGRSMSVEAVGVGGRPFADIYALARRGDRDRRGGAGVRGAVAQVVTPRLVPVGGAVDAPSANGRGFAGMLGGRRHYSLAAPVEKPPFPLCARMQTAARLMPIPGHIDPVPVPRAASCRAATGAIDLLGLSQGRSARWRWRRRSSSRSRRSCAPSSCGTGSTIAAPPTFALMTDISQDDAAVAGRSAS